MDLMYLPDAFTFHVIRSPPIYNHRGHDYLDAMVEEEEEARRRKMRKAKEKKGKSTVCADAGPIKENHHSPGSGKSSSKDSCPMCKERRRRTLASYIRTKSRQDSTENSVIEEEEEDAEQEEKQADEQIERR